MSRRETLLRNILARELGQAQARNPRFSMRAFAKRLGVSAPTLSRILAGKSNLSKDTERRIIQNLPVPAADRDRLLALEHDPYVTVAPSNRDLRALIDEWYYSPIVCLAETRAFREDPKWIARRLGISAAQASEALACLQRIGFLRRDPASGRLAPIDVGISTKGVSARRHDRNLLQKLEVVRKCLRDGRRSAQESSDISSIVLATSPRKLPEAKRRIQRFRRSLAKFLGSGEKSEVYLIYVQLVPMSVIR